MTNPELAARARSAIDSKRMECVGELEFVGPERIPLDLIIGVSADELTPDLAVFGFRGGEWRRLPDQNLDIVSREARAPISEPGFYALLRVPRRRFVPFSPSPAELATASEVGAALAPLAQALTELLAPHPTKLSPDQMQGLEALLRKLRFTPVALFTRYGFGVWHRDPGSIGKIAELEPDGKFLFTRALGLAYRGKKTVACTMAPNGFEVGFPLLTDWIVGVLIVHCRQDFEREAD